MLSNFTVEDITHKPKRRQGQSVGMQVAEFINQVAKVQAETQSALSMLESMPRQFITLEKAISFYESYPNCELYRYTAVCLRELLEYRKNIIVVNEKAKEKELQNADNEEAEV